MREQLEKIKNQALSELLSAENEAALEELRVKVLGKRSELSAVLRGMGQLSAEERPVVGA
ncbi:MAG: phenylalanine--tRNA ligase subunit alpha, partial [Clostridiales bacterium]|nr:phenylalanine--tRNA ligase subunit alpha [Clostridiales bacterium]